MAFPALPSEPGDCPVWAGPGLEADPLRATVRAEVAVVGAGLVALRVAAGLAAAGARVVLLAPDADLSGSAERGDGLVVGAWDDNAWRLVQSVGAARAQELVTWADRGADALGMPENGVWIGALQDQEATELAETVALRERWGLPAHPGAPPGYAGGFSARGGAVQPWALAAAAATAARRAGVVCRAQAPVLRADQSAGGHLLHTPGGTAHADLLVLCGDHRMQAAWPWLGDKLRPVRHQHRHHRAGRVAQPTSAQFGYLSAVPGPSGVILGGCRWATPHLEEGETDAAVVRTVVDQKIGSLWQDRAVGLDPVPAARWSRIATHTCDGLPLIGPLPGAPTVVACCGFNGRPLTHAALASAAVIEGVLEGRASAVPAILRPDRFVG